jgi:hypothetical protein
MQAEMECFRVLNGGTFDSALYNRIAKFRTAGSEADAAD